MSEFGYPQARRLDLTEEVLGHQVSDPYRWLEDDTSAERAEWLRAQGGLFGAYRDELAGSGPLPAQGRRLLGTGYSPAPVCLRARSSFTPPSPVPSPCRASPPSPP